MIIRYQGNEPKLPRVLQYPNTDNSHQPWHLRSFIDASKGIELLFPFDDVEIKDSVSAPFHEWSNEIYILHTQTQLVVPEKYNLLILPHSNYYLQNDVPLPLPEAWQFDWFPFCLSVRFVKRGISKFYKGQPYAQAVLVPRDDYQVVPLTDKEIAEKEKTKAYLEKEFDNIVTREWISKHGYKENNLYDRLAENLPEELKPRQKHRQLIKRHK